MGGHQCTLQLLIQPWIRAPGTHYGWVGQDSVEYEVCPTLLHMASTGSRTPDLLILSPMPYPLGHMLPLSKLDGRMDLFIGPEEFVVGYSKAPEQPQSSARPICHSHTMTRTGREPATLRIAA